MEFIITKNNKQILIPQVVEQKKLNQNLSDLKLLMPFIMDSMKKFPFLKKYLKHGK